MIVNTLSVDLVLLETVMLTRNNSDAAFLGYGGPLTLFLATNGNGDQLEKSRGLVYGAVKSIFAQAAVG